MKNKTWQQSKLEKKLSFKRALIWILFSTALISGTAALATLYYFNFQEIQLQDEHYTITTIQQVGQDSGRLSTSYLAELLELSIDSKVNLIGYKIDQAEKKLLISPIIKSAKVYKVKPSTLAINYSLRKPLFRLIDFENAAIDKEGMVFPITPFFDCDELPELYLGTSVESFKWGQIVELEEEQLALEIVDSVLALDLFKTIEIRKIDVSKIRYPSSGERQVVIVCRERGFFNDWILRFRVSDIQQQMIQFVSLLEYLHQEQDYLSSKIIDFRAPDLAFMQNL